MHTLPWKHSSFELERCLSAWPANGTSCQSNQSNTDTFKTLYKFIINHYSFLNTSCKWRKGHPIISFQSNAAEGGRYDHFTPLLYKAGHLSGGTTWSVQLSKGVVISACEKVISHKGWHQERRLGVSESKWRRRLGMEVGYRDVILIQRVSYLKDSNSTGTKAKAT